MHMYIDAPNLACTTGHCTNDAPRFPGMCAEIIIHALCILHVGTNYRREDAFVGGARTAETPHQQSHSARATTPMPLGHDASWAMSILTAKKFAIREARDATKRHEKA